MCLVCGGHICIQREKVTTIVDVIQLLLKLLTTVNELSVRMTFDLLLCYTLVIYISTQLYTLCGKYVLK